jgi:hypothetical protein
MESALQAILEQLNKLNASQVNHQLAKSEWWPAKTNCKPTKNK